MASFEEWEKRYLKDKDYTVKDRHWSKQRRIGWDAAIASMQERMAEAAVRARIEEHQAVCHECLNFEDGWGDPGCERLSQLRAEAEKFGK
jgi:hypothetical protein